MTFDLYNTGQKPIVNDQFPELNILNVPVLDIEIIRPENGSEIRNCLKKEPLLVFQSKSGVAGFSRWLESQQILNARFKAIYATGAQTNKLVQKFFHRTALIPEVQNASGLVELIGRRKTKYPVLIVTGTMHRKEAIIALKQRGWNLTHAIVYNTLPSINRELRNLFENSPEEIVMFTSPSTVEGFLLSSGLADLGELRAKVLSIGPTTSKWIRERAGTVYVEAPVPDISAALSAVLEKLKKTI